MSKIYRVPVPESQWPVANGEAPVVEATQKIVIEIWADGRRSISSNRTIQKCLDDGTPIIGEGPPPGALAAGRHVERNLAEVKDEVVNELKVGEIATAVAACIDKWAEEDRAKVAELTPMP